jgi:hypothetical protein
VCISSRNCDNSSENNGVFQGYKGYKAKGYQDITGQTSGCICNKCFKPSFGSIRAILAEIEAVKILAKAKFLAKANVTFSFTSFYELYKCAVEHVYSQGYKGYKLPPIYNSNSNCICNKRVHINKCFKHSFSSIRAILAELEVFQIYEAKAKNKDRELVVAFSFSSFCELYKCAVEHASANANANAYANELYKCAVEHFRAL